MGMEMAGKWAGNSGDSRGTSSSNMAARTRHRDRQGHLCHHHCSTPPHHASSPPLHLAATDRAQKAKRVDSPSVVTGLGAVCNDDWLGGTDRVFGSSDGWTVETEIIDTVE